MVGGYEITEYLGKGANASVFKALKADWEAGLRQEVALKILHSRTAVLEWRNEFRSLMQVESPYCVRVLGFDRAKGSPALVLEWVDGLSLATILGAHPNQKLPWEDLVAQIAQGLSDLHRAGLCHGDLSPANILIRRDGQIKLVDFGLANYTGEKIQATLDYAAPEVLEGQLPTPQSDWYSLAKIWQLHGHRARHPWVQRTLAVGATSRESLRLEERPWGRREISDLVTQLMDGEACPITAKFSRALSGVLSRSNGRFQRMQDRINLWPLRAIANLLAIAAISGSISVSANINRLGFRTPTQIRLRSQLWLKVRVNGVDRGYTPVDLEGQPGMRFRVELESSNGPRLRFLTLPRFGTILLSEKELL